ncbi:RecQ family ATP-dependent DNA helicase [Streptomyces lomondensis]|uniref:ATP-dependent DNA helicase RecQ n=1 Tax=Streptomyces lomondensis TaxID=68229 RepID=A0ABQ2XT54_9ACTN|nr:RecQ family ATP-dependent DNA helicase [Streptomyces lomondensis]MCF0083031.1 RecQ family ATP-dependent DNA helicase [Streptomyces lomondensis]GGX31932.1 ATP-dependent DNA helicase RecQ [Streptomyces lomondensis]
MGRERPRTDRSRAARLRQAAAEVFGWDTLLPEQLTAMEWVLDGEDTLVVMPTGAGKSAVYQVPALLLSGPVVVVSPLLALQRDQIAGLPDGDRAPGAVAVNSDLGAAATEDAWDAVRRGDARLLYLSPEQLAKDEVVERLAEARPALFVVDEAQCVSSWGHDFRPDYLRLEQAARRVGRPPVLALTATAAAPVRREIAERLGMRRPRLLVTGFDRPNIRLEARRFLDDDERRRAVVERAAVEPKPGIVYAGTRRDSEHYARELAALGLATEAYHAGLRAAERERIHDAFLSGAADVVVATSAFGMGIDKEDVRFVLHASLPGSLDAYYQEIGRCGRDGHPALAVLHYRSEDTGMQTYFAGRAPGRDTLSDVAHAVHEHREDPRDLDELRQETGLSRNRVTAAVNLLEEADAVATGEEGEVRPAGGVSPGQAVEEAARAAQAHRRTDRTRVEMARAYAETTGCRRRFLLGYFGEEHAGPCGNCDLCDADPAGQGPEERPAHPAAAAYPVGTEVRHEQWGEGMVLSEDQDRITVFFGQAGYRTLALEAVAGHDGLLTVVRRPGEDRWAG